MKREMANTGAQREHRVGVPQVVEVAQRLDASGCPCRLPMPAAEAAEVDPPTSRVREQDFAV
jgi:hypothetical protein